MMSKSLSLAAGMIMAASVAQAADLGRPAPAAVDYVKVCDAYGAGFGLTSQAALGWFERWLRPAS